MPETRTDSPQPTVSLRRRLRDEPIDTLDLAEDLHEATKFYETTIARQAHSARFFADQDLVASAALGVREMPHLSSIALPCAEDCDQPDQLIRGASAQSFTGEPLGIADLGRLLWLSYGRLPETAGVGDGTVRARRRPVASGGHLYPLELYVLSASSGPAHSSKSSIYHYNPRRHSLELVRDSIGRERLRRLSPPAVVFDTAPVVVLIMGMFHRSRFKYGLRGYRFTLIEAGAVIHQMQLAAQFLGLGSRPYAVLFDDVVEELCRVDGTDESFINAVLVGHERR